MKAIVLCGGKGTRLRPYTYSIPKPMLPLGKKPILEFAISNLKRYGFEEIYLTVGYLKEQIMDYFGDGSKFGVKIKYFTEEKEMNTAGSILPCKNHIDETFLVAMGDHLTTINAKKFVDFHKKKGAFATLALKRTGVPLEYGVAHTDADYNILKFEEKPIVQNLVNSGIYCFEPEVFDYIKVGYDFARDVFPALMKDKKKVCGYIFDEYWIDIGRVPDYEHLNQTISIVDLVTHGK
ncbi:MAG: nucleotidyltransferase family protein [Candidatus Micrarchaeota archaeon]|nr:nucleotidyltransferase family protein [Candidatus Micrarchaeota archaeon]